MRRRFPRLAAGALIATLAIAPAGMMPAFSAPSSQQVRNEKQHLAQARNKLHAITQHFSLVVEQYDQARVKLGATQQKLDAAQAAADEAKQKEADARSVIATQTATAYESGLAGNLSVILGAQSVTDLSERMQFLDDLAAQQSRRAAAADVAHQKAKWAAQDLTQARTAQQAALANLEQKKTAVQRASQRQKSLITRLSRTYHQDLAAQRRAQRRAAAAAASASFGVGSSGGFVPKSSGAAGAVEAALSRVGSAYVYGAAGPSAFDCSGLTMWSWAQVGVSLPHSSSAQYASLPHVSTSALQPGDLLFFYSPISHVGIYIGNGRMVAADNPATGVHIDSLGGYWNSVMVGAARPG